MSEESVNAVLKERYYQEGETCWEDICDRVCTYMVPEVEEGTTDEGAEYYTYCNMLNNKEFIPNSPVLFNFGTAHSMGMACLGLDIKDDLKDIYKKLGWAARIFKMGGGCGFNFSNIRPKGDPVGTTNGVASGVVSFMKLFDASTEVIKQGGKRRGAAIAILSCLEGDTYIHTIDGKIKIKDLVGQRPYVYSIDDKGGISIQQADKVYISGKNRNVVRVWFDNDDWIDCTPDHRIMLSNGSYKEAQDLELGDSIMAFHKCVNSHGNTGRFVKSIGMTGHITRARLEHHIIARDILGYDVDYRKYNAHHIDENPLNNNPSNIEVLDRSTHASKHTTALLEYQKINAANKKGKTLEELYGEERAHEIRKGMSERRKKQPTWNKGLTGDLYKEHYTEGFANQYSNHKVIKVEDMGVADNVYDISMPEYHNFVANGVFVHNCDHPEIVDFINCKSVEGDLSNFNISVMLTDAFMEAVYNDEPFDLVYEGKVYTTCSARDLYSKICTAIWKNGEPGLLFYDRINKDNPTPEFADIHVTNPCGEQPIQCNPETGAGEACNLGSINLVAMLATDGSGNKYIDMPKLEKTVENAVRFLDKVIDKTEFPLKGIEKMTKGNRKIGLGVMGFADMLIEMGLPYDPRNERTIAIIRDIMSVIKRVAVRTSKDLAIEPGEYPNWRIGGDDPKTQWLRNATLLCIAPTGTISMIAGVSSGIEPNFSFVYDRKNSTGTFREVHSKFDEDLKKECACPNSPGGIDADYYDLAINHMHETGTIQDVPWLTEEFRAIFKTALDINPEDHIGIQAEFQKYIDSSISKTINCPESTTIDDIKVYVDFAHNSGLKGLTFYRQNSRNDVVLNLKKDDPVPIPTPKTDTILDEYDGLVYRYSPESGMGVTKKRPEGLPGHTYKAKSGCGKLYITVNTKDNAPYEVFVKTSGNGGCEANINAIGRLISIALREGVPPSVITKQLGRVCCPVALKNGCSYKGKSCPDIIGKVLNLCGNPEPTIQATLEETSPDAKEKVNIVTQPIGDWKQGTCPSCGSKVERSEGCLVCRNCGDSKC